MSETKLEVKGLSKTFTSRNGSIIEVFKDLNFRVANNEFFSLIGPSGCGKTTLIRIIAGLLEPTEGEILLEGQISMEPSADKGVVFQADAVFPWMTVQQNVEYGLKVRRIPKRKREVIAERYINLVGLNGFENSFPKELSGGMRKRVDLARVYANNPQIMLMDEPFGALDAQTKEKMQIELLRIWSTDKKTVIFITHDLEEAVFLADRVAILSERPSRIKEIINIDLPRPRTEELKISDQFQHMKRLVWQLFRDGLNNNI